MTEKNYFTRMETLVGRRGLLTKYYFFLTYLEKTVTITAELYYASLYWTKTSRHSQIWNNAKSRLHLNGTNLIPFWNDH